MYAAIFMKSCELRLTFKQTDAVEDAVSFVLLAFIAAIAETAYRTTAKTMPVSAHPR
jgi:hypothetical protein